MAKDFVTGRKTTFGKKPAFSKIAVNVLLNKELLSGKAKRSFLASIIEMPSFCANG